jgi:hypothetical protein
MFGWSYFGEKTHFSFWSEGCRYKSLEDVDLDGQPLDLSLTQPALPDHFGSSNHRSSLVHDFENLTIPPCKALKFPTSDLTFSKERSKPSPMAGSILM